MYEPVTCVKVFQNETNREIRFRNIVESVGDVRKIVYVAASSGYNCNRMMYNSLLYAGYSEEAVNRIPDHSGGGNQDEGSVSQQEFWNE